MTWRSTTIIPQTFKQLVDSICVYFVWDNFYQESQASDKGVNFSQEMNIFLGIPEDQSTTTFNSDVTYIPNIKK